MKPDQISTAGHPVPRSLRKANKKGQTNDETNKQRDKQTRNVIRHICPPDLDL